MSSRSRSLPLSPAIFTTVSDGVGNAIAVSPDGTIAASADSIPGLITRPAHAGDPIVILATGLGAVTPVVANGANSSRSAPHHCKHSYRPDWRAACPTSFLRVKPFFCRGLPDQHGHSGRCSGPSCITPIAGWRNHHLQTRVTNCNPIVVRIIARSGNILAAPLVSSQYSSIPTRRSLRRLPSVHWGTRRRP